MAELGLPAAAGELLAQPRGLVLVTGPAGSGKSSSLAAMVNELNDSRALHIITLRIPSSICMPQDIVLSISGK